jgi:hypothetical protein
MNRTMEALDIASRAFLFRHSASLCGKYLREVRKRSPLYARETLLDARWL